MKKTIHLTVALFSIIQLTMSGQDSTKIKNKEFYLTFSNFSPITLQIKYKRQITKKKYFKIGLVNLYGYGNTQNNYNPASFGTINSGFSTGLEIGIEFRKELSKKISVFHGPNLSFTFQQSTSKRLDPSIPIGNRKDITQTYLFSIPYSIGLLYNLNQNILFGAEINPALNFYHQEYKNGQNGSSNYLSDNLNIHFDNRLVSLSIVCRL